MADSEQHDNCPSTKIRHDWYQTETHVIVNILYKNVKDSELTVGFRDDSLNVSFPVETGDKYNLNLKLAYEVNSSECSYKALPSKIEIKLKKKEDLRWTKLDDGSRIKDVSSGEPMPEGESSTQLDQSALKKGKDWDKVVSEIINSEEYKPVGEEALSAFFEKIYAEGSDEVKKAMNKSLVESNGTVLSTNWAQIKQGKVDVRPPDGMEWKKWDS